jgi:KaiC/GvpD/RAD55 family RecA-like ATPase
VYITLDQPATQCIVDAESVGLSLAPYLCNNHLKILDLTHYFNNTEAIHDDVFSATQLVDDIRRFIAKFGAQRVVMDPVSPLIFRHSRSLAVLEYLRQLIGMFESKIESTVVLIANAHSGGLDQHDTEAFATAGVIQLQHSVDVMEHQRHICVYKMRGVSIQSGCFPVTITPGVGVVVTP